MPPGGDAVVVPATLDNVRNGLAIDFQVGHEIQPKFATPMTMRRPPDLVAALATETAEKKMRIRRNLLT